MMHNSFLIRDRLLAANHSPMHRQRRNAHRWVYRDKGIHAASGEIELSEVWNVKGDLQVSGMKEAIEDFSEFLRIMEVDLSDDSEQTVEFLLASDGEEETLAFEISAEAGRILITATSIGGIWSSLVYLEKMMMQKKAPIVSAGIVCKQPRWNTQISQAPFGANFLVPDLSPEYLSDDAFRQLIHQGINAMTLYGDWLCYTRNESFPELNHADYDQNIATLRDAAQRAGKYGVKLYYVAVSPKLDSKHPVFQRSPQLRGSKIAGNMDKAQSIHCFCSSSEDSLALHEEVMENLFQEVPELGGLILIVGGESYYHCFMRPDLEGTAPGAKTDCPVCAGRKPEDVVNHLLKVTAEAVHRAQPQAAVMAWPYSAFRWSSDEAQLELVQTLPDEVDWLNTIDKDQWAKKDGYHKLIWDYSVDYTGPADNLLAQINILQDKNSRLFVKSETAIGLEAFHIPYFPSMQRIAEKWSHVRDTQPSGVLQAWMFFGMWGSRAEEIGWWMNWMPELDAANIVRMLAERDFGKHAEGMIAAWANMSESAGRYPFIPPYFSGPEFIGPAHPLLLRQRADELPEFIAELYFLQEMEETFSESIRMARHSVVHSQLFDLKGMMRLEAGTDYWEVALREFDKAAYYAGEAVKQYEAIAAAGVQEGVPGELFREEQVLSEFVYRTLVTTRNTYHFLHLKERIKAGEAAGQKELKKQMLAIARAELDNAKRAEPLYAEAPWLDLALRFEGLFPSSPMMLKKKIELLQEDLTFLEGELGLMGHVAEV
ncbi:hypothetical protein [Paenibacillus eucommiae]|uniref:Beta-hexosaminidase bacterial type N-terminal domain-containing protein n=1 Tax=Paenibacillus eucommiae TaxID=1355755 RepID=A0ABS4IYZ2_9BACL|nr:hypothetical protein [Paenibacillus eucommiae]MBP1992081.1 hypothetical protein [Paenibacillus eucommiae]